MLESSVWDIREIYFRQGNILSIQGGWRETPGRTVIIHALCDHRPTSDKQRKSCDKSHRFPPPFCLLLELFSTIRVYYFQNTTIINFSLLYFKVYRKKEKNVWWSIFLSTSLRFLNPQPVDNNIQWQLCPVAELTVSENRCF